jgi:hypothetical protein
MCKCGVVGLSIRPIMLEAIRVETGKMMIVTMVTKNFQFVGMCYCRVVGLMISRPITVIAVCSKDVIFETRKPLFWDVLSSFALSLPKKLGTIQ